MIDALTLTAIVDELSPIIRNGWIQRVVLLDELSLGLEIYADHQRHQLLISAHPQEARFHLVETRLTADRERVTPFLLLLRKYLRGGQVLALTQPPLERTVELSIAKHFPLDKPRDTALSEPIVLTSPSQILLSPPNRAAPAPVNRNPGGVTKTTTDDIAEAAAMTSADAADAASAAAEADAADAADEADAASAASAAAEEADGFDVVVRLVIEIMGRHSNIILLDSAGKILDSIKRVPASVNRYRTVLPRRPYRAPPDQAKADPATVDSAWWQSVIERTPVTTPLATLLVRELRAVSPQIGRELAFRVAGSVDAPLAAVPTAADLLTALHELFGQAERHAWQPRLYRREGHPVAFSPWPLRSLQAQADLEEVALASPSAAAAAFFDASRAVTGHGQTRAHLLDLIGAEREKVVGRRRSLGEQLEAATAADRYRREGELIYAYIHSLQPGQSRLEVDGQVLEIDGQPIMLDPSLTPVENAKHRFERYRRARLAVVNLPELVAEADLALAYYDQLLAFTQLAEGFEELQALEGEWREYERGQRGDARPTQSGERDRGRGQPGGGKGPRQGGREPGGRRRAAADRAPRRLRTPRGDAILIGRNGRQNDLVTFELGGPHDLWLHARGLPGAHVILQSQGEPGDQLIELAAQLAAYYSPARGATAVEVDVTERRHVRKVKGGPPGLVTYRQERTIRVAPRSEEALHALGRLGSL